MVLVRHERHVDLPPPRYHDNDIKEHALKHVGGELKVFVEVEAEVGLTEQLVEGYKGKGIMESEHESENLGVASTPDIIASQPSQVKNNAMKSKGKMQTRKKSRVQGGNVKLRHANMRAEDAEVVGTPNILPPTETVHLEESAPPTTLPSEISSQHPQVLTMPGPLMFTQMQMSLPSQATQSQTVLHTRLSIRVPLPMTGTLPSFSTRSAKMTEGSKSIVLEGGRKYVSKWHSQAKH
ncbi:hypothetical protein Salat_0648400 [Sesamum alatum]|uniref:Uncharacterized protein n=1 Tax=Sesamum alatum TaxID=300844 RepID=A0AAE2CUD8_9LAMI|nr:hypothetical protein Salat_0648400 [Sesamum alatum]